MICPQWRCSGAAGAPPGDLRRQRRRVSGRRSDFGNSFSSPLIARVRQAAVRVREIAARTAQREAARRRRRKLLGTVAGVGGIGVAAGAVALRSSGLIEEPVEVECHSHRL